MKGKLFLFHLLGALSHTANICLFCSGVKSQLELFFVSIRLPTYSDIIDIAAMLPYIMTNPLSTFDFFTCKVLLGFCQKYFLPPDFIFNIYIFNNFRLVFYSQSNIFQYIVQPKNLINFAKILQQLLDFLIFLIFKTLKNCVLSSNVGLSSSYITITNVILHCHIIDQKPFDN